MLLLYINSSVIFNKIFIIIIISTNLYPRDPNLEWDKIYNLEIGNNAFIRKVTKWINMQDKKKAILLKIQKKKIDSIQGYGRIYIFQYETEELIPVDFKFIIDKKDLNYRVLYFETKIFEHEINYFQYQKDIELQKAKIVFRELSKDLNKYLLDKENNFNNWFKIWLW